MAFLADAGTFLHLSAMTTTTPPTPTDAEQRRAACHAMSAAPGPDPFRRPLHALAPRRRGRLPARDGDRAHARAGDRAPALHGVAPHRAAPRGAGRRERRGGGRAPTATPTSPRRTPSGCPTVGWPSTRSPEWRERYRVIQDGLAGLTDAQRICLILQSARGELRADPPDHRLLAAQGRAVGARGAGGPCTPGRSGSPRARSCSRLLPQIDRARRRRGHGDARAARVARHVTPLRAVPGDAARPPRVERVAGRPGAGRVPRHGDPRRAPAGPDARAGLVGPPGRRRDGQARATPSRWPWSCRAAPWRRWAPGHAAVAVAGAAGAPLVADAVRPDPPPQPTAAIERPATPAATATPARAAARTGPTRAKAAPFAAARRRAASAATSPPGRSRGPPPARAALPRGPIRRPRASRPGLRRPRRRRPPRPCNPRRRRHRPGTVTPASAPAPTAASPWSSAREARATAAALGARRRPRRGPRGAQATDGALYGYGSSVWAARPGISASVQAGPVWLVQAPALNPAAAGNLWEMNWGCPVPGSEIAAVQFGALRTQAPSSLAVAVDRRPADPLGRGRRRHAPVAGGRARLPHRPPRRAVQRPPRPRPRRRRAPSTRAATSSTTRACWCATSRRPRSCCGT